MVIIVLFCLSLAISEGSASSKSASHTDALQTEDDESCRTGDNKTESWEEILETEFTGACTHLPESPNELDVTLANLSCRPNNERVILALTKAAGLLPKHDVQKILYDIVKVYHDWPRVWDEDFAVLLGKHHPWTHDFCAEAPKDLWTALLTFGVKHIVLLSDVSQHIVLGRPHWVDSFAEFFQDLRSSSKDPHVQFQLDAVLTKGFVNATIVTNLLNYIHAKPMRHLLLDVCHKVPHALRSLEETGNRYNYKCDGETSLQMAAQSGDTPMVEVLVEAFLDNDQIDFINTADCDGYTAEHLARNEHFRDTADVIRSFMGEASYGAKEREPVRLFPSPIGKASNTGHGSRAGWNLSDAGAVPDEFLPEGLCEFDTIDASQFDWDLILQHYVRHGRPLLIRRGAKMVAAVAKFYTRKGLVNLVGDEIVRGLEVPYIGNANGPQDMSIRDYLAFLDGRVNHSQSLHYVFEFIGKEEVGNLRFAHVVPEILQGRLREYDTQFFLGGVLMGSALHCHPPAANALHHGKKLWFIRPPGHRFWLNRSEPMFTYLVRTGGAPGALRCVQDEGDLLLVPLLWWHGAICLSDCIGVAYEFS